MKIVVAMSGGVDSSTTAALLCEAGHEVIGVAMKTHAAGVRTDNRACCTPDDMRDARAVADRIGIPFYVIDYAEVFAREVIGPFAASYRRGETPNPCIECNDRVKFRPLLARARLLGAEALATGHYARIDTDPGGRPRLRRGRDRHKDQAYFLYRLDAPQLDLLRFPIGDLTKDEVRAHARRFDLPTAEKPESQEICFVGPEGYAAVVERMGGAAPAGDIVSSDGRVLGRHDGIHRFTLGQRRGLHIAAPEPLYVTALDPERNEVVVGRAGEGHTDSVEVTGLRWVAGPPADGARVFVQQRYREKPRAAHVHFAGTDRVELRFEAPAPRGAPGQAAVLFDEDDEIVLGGGTLARADGAA